MSRQWMLRIGAAALVLVGLGAAATMAGATANTDHMLRGEKLVSGAEQKSLNGRYRLVQQADGNLVEYQGDKAIWSTRTAGHPGAYTYLQKDGNLVVYRRGEARPENKLWETNTDGMGVSHLTVQNDGNVVVYAGSGQALWSSQPPATQPGSIGDDYPAKWRGGLGTTTDTWGQYTGYCTSFVAWRLHSRNHYELPRWKGNANTWANVLGHVHATPRVGAVAQTDAGTYGHVAWVAAVDGKRVLLEDYNWHLDGRYSQHWEPASSYKYLYLNG